MLRYVIDAVAGSAVMVLVHELGHITGYLIQGTVPSLSVTPWMIRVIGDDVSLFVVFLAPVFMVVTALTLTNLIDSRAFHLGMGVQLLLNGVYFILPVGDGLLFTELDAGLIAVISSAALFTVGIPIFVAAFRELRWSTIELPR